MYRDHVIIPFQLRSGVPVAGPARRTPDAGAAEDAEPGVQSLLRLRTASPGSAQTDPDAQGARSGQVEPAAPRRRPSAARARRVELDQRRPRVETNTASSGQPGKCAVRALDESFQRVEPKLTYLW